MGHAPWPRPWPAPAPKQAVAGNMVSMPAAKPLRCLAHAHEGSTPQRPPPATDQTLPSPSLPSPRIPLTHTPTAPPSYYPLLQELSFIRPLRMLSPLAFVNGIHTDAYTNNSCPTGWGSAACTTDDGWVGSDDCMEVICSGTLAVSGTGPFKLISRTQSVCDDDGLDNYDDEVVFQSFDDYWGGDSDLDYLKIVRYESASDVYDALIAGTLDAVIGAGVLDPSDVQTLVYNDDFTVEHTDPIMNAVIIMNAGTVPIDVRKTIVHAVDKGYIIDKELGGIEEPVSQLFPEAAPYCDVYLTPKFDYDLEKAEELNCPEHDEHEDEDDEYVDPAIGVLAVFLAIAFVVVIVLAYKNHVAEEKYALLAAADPTTGQKSGVGTVTLVGAPATQL